MGAAAGYETVAGVTTNRPVQIVRDNGTLSSLTTFSGSGAGLTNVEATINVLDTHNGTLVPYVNPQGTAFAPIQDTKAFATCP